MIKDKRQMNVTSKKYRKKTLDIKVINTETINK